MTISMKPLDDTNWYKVYDLSVNDGQKSYKYRNSTIMTGGEQREGKENRE
jgi:hypothetical protein